MAGGPEAESCWASSGLKRRGWLGVAERFTVHVWFVLGVMWVLAGVRAGMMRRGDCDAAAVNDDGDRSSSGGSVGVAAAVVTVVVTVMMRTPRKINKKMMMMLIIMVAICFSNWKCCIVPRLPASLQCTSTVRHQFVGNEDDHWLLNLMGA